MLRSCDAQEKPCSSSCRCSGDAKRWTSACWAQVPERIGFFGNIDGRWMCDNWIVEAGFNYQRLLTWPHFDQFYRESVPRWGVRR